MVRVLDAPEVGIRSTHLLVHGQGHGVGWHLLGMQSSFAFLLIDLTSCIWVVGCEVDASW